MESNPAAISGVSISTIVPCTSRSDAEMASAMPPAALRWTTPFVRGLREAGAVELPRVRPFDVHGVVTGRSSGSDAAIASIWLLDVTHREVQVLAR